MRVKIDAGAEFDLASPAETRQIVREQIDAWQKEITRPVKFRTFSSQINATGATWQMSDPTSDPIGPREGFIWSVTRFTVAGGGVVPGTDAYQVGVNELSPSKLIETGYTRGARFDVGALVLNPGDRLVFSGASTGTVGQPIVVSGAAIEIPVQLGWRLL